MQNVKISFLVTYYNQEKYVFDSLCSISKLNLPFEYEVLVGDDGSDDLTLSEVNKWKPFFNTRLRIFEMPRDKKKTNDPTVRLGNLHKYLLKQSVGEYFCFLDGDDYYCDRNFVIDSLQIYKTHSDLSIVMFNYELVYSKQVRTARSLPREGVIEAQKYIRNYYKHVGTCVFKRCGDATFFTRLMKSLYYDDSDITTHNLCFGALYYVDRVIYSYRQLDDSMWNRMNRAQQGIQNLLGAENSAFLAPKFKEDIFFRFRKDILYAYFRRENPAEFIGKEFLERYIWLSSGQSEYSLSKSLLDFTNASEDEKNELENIILWIKEKDEELYSSIKKNCI